MRFDLGSKFAFLDDRRVECPFVGGSAPIVFRLARLDSPGYRDSMAGWREKVEAGMRPQAAAFAAAQGRAMMLGTARALKGKVLEDWVARKTEELVTAMPAPELEGMLDGFDNASAIAEFLILDVEGLEAAGSPVEYSPAVGLELLELGIPFVEDFEDGELEIPGGVTLGQAIRLWVLHEAGLAERFRSDWVEGAGKN